ncbi:NAD-dependent epimerase/dehydratase family protein [Rhizobium sp. Root1220]|uniref:NAD-dependent epimerase/dehydratase family protein n=1 Tax=Rhizobium sp. Root1220 TaxID=1736432 RepID=UPI0006FF80DB|nr:NAD-dependent epimerase/dehydratase family protein [Rhizobium sp. Root1220]KQV84057.1 nucleoside-diphosphate sugar epimerase [Rhizobium sp. Root1220]
MLLVTGTTGFVGRHLQPLLQRRNLPFRAVSRLSMAGHLAVGDISGSTDWNEALVDVDVIVHLAARNQNVVERPVSDAAEFTAVNVDGTVNLARQAATRGVKRFVFVSTIKVNGEQTAPGQPFSANAPVSPKTAYAASKFEAEQRLAEISATSGMEVVIVRPPLVYGRGVAGSFDALVRLVKSGMPLPFASIDNRRSILYVENLADLLVSAALHPAAAGNVLMPADEAALATPELIRLIAQATGKSVRLLPCPAGVLRGIANLTGKGDLAGRVLDSLEVDASETRRLLGWTPPFQTPDAIRRSI